VAEVNNNGFLGKTQNQYFDEEKQLYLAIDPNWNLEPSSPDGLKMASDAEIFANLDEAARLAYNAKDPSKARGIELDVICSLTGTFRDLGAPSFAELTLTGNVGAFIPAGTLFESAVDGSQWAIHVGVFISGSGSVTATANCTANGATQADANTITKIVDVVAGLQLVDNPAIATAGMDIQTDAALRLERRQAVARSGSNQVDNMAGGVHAADDVTHVRVYENPTGVVDANGQPAHSLAVIASGGADNDVAQAMYIKKNPGVLLFQPPSATPVTVLVTSPIYAWNTQEMKFSRPTYIDMNLVIGINNDGTLPSDAADQIKQAIVDYAQGSLIESNDGFRQVPFDIGEDVPYGSMYTPINSILGKYGNSYVGNMTINGGTVNAEIDWTELSRWSTSLIEVVIT